VSRIATDIARALSPVEFCRSIGFEPDSWQQSVLESQHPRILLNVTRQGGKSWVVAAKAVHVCAFEPGSLVLCIAPSLRQSSELFLKIRTIARSMDGGAPPAETESATTWTLSNGSRCVVLPGTQQTVRSFSSCRLLLVDEAARVDDAAIAACRAFLAVSHGQLIMLSTPAGSRGSFYEAWESGGNAYERYRVPATDCPRISAEFLAEERLALGEWLYKSEYECSFESCAAAAVFRDEDIEAMFRQEVEIWPV